MSRPDRWTRRLAVCAVVLLCGSPCAQAKDYYVATNGRDTNAGTLALPFLTIQKAASVLVAGDRVYIREGTYRESVRPANSGTAGAPITFQPYGSEKVTISGADLIPTSAWSVSSGSVYKAAMDWDLGEGNNQIFLDGQMMIEARWPNTTLDVSHPTSAQIGGGSYVDGGSGLSTATITGLDLPSSKPAGYWTGAAIHIALFKSEYEGAGWFWQTGAVTSSDTGQLSFTFQKLPTEPSSRESITPGPKNPYFLTGKLGELDTGGEWFLDASTLYFQTPTGDSPARHVTEAKRRQIAFNLAGRSFVTVQGLSIFASSIVSDRDSQYLVLDGLNVQYVWHQALIPNVAASFVGTNYSGIILDGKNNILKNSTIAFSSGNGVQIIGPGQRVVNNVIHDTDYAANEASPIAAGFSSPTTTGFLIAWNTAYNTARHGISHTNLNANTGRGRILHNEVYNFAIQTTDIGCIYSYGSDGNGTEIAYNLCHHDHGTRLGAGIYLDFDSSNYVVHHNVVWDTHHSVRMNSVSRHNRIYNNTFAAGSSGVGLAISPGRDDTAQFPDSGLKNNIWVYRVSALLNNSGAVQQNNLFVGTDPQFVDAGQNNFQLKATSPAVDGGTTASPYTDGFLGKAPDIGAYEFGAVAWKAGGGQTIATVEANTPNTTLSKGAAALATVAANVVQTGTTVTVTDGAGVDLQARIIDVLSGLTSQIRFEIPASVTPGVAVVTIVTGSGSVFLGSAPIF